MTLTKADIIERVGKIGFTKKKSGEIAETLLEIIKATLESGEDVLLSGFGKFCVRDKKKRKGRNIQTGEDMFLGERMVITFKCSSLLRDKINRKRIQEMRQDMPINLNCNDHDPI